MTRTMGSQSKGENGRRQGGWDHQGSQTTTAEIQIVYYPYRHMVCFGKGSTLNVTLTLCLWFTPLLMYLLHHCKRHYFLFRLVPRLSRPHLPPHLLHERGNGLRGKGKGRRTQRGSIGNSSSDFREELTPWCHSLPEATIEGYRPLTRAVRVTRNVNEVKTLG